MSVDTFHLDHLSELFQTNRNRKNAMDFGKRFKRLFTPESIPFIRECVTTKSWWDTVDTITIHFTGAVVYQYPKTGKVMDK